VKYSIGSLERLLGNVLLTYFDAIFHSLHIINPFSSNLVINLSRYSYEPSGMSKLQKNTFDTKPTRLHIMKLDSILHFF
jgi:hypothetical protein